MKTPEHRTILVVDDDATLLLALMNRLSNAGFNVQTATTGRDALKIARGRRFDAIALKAALPGEMGGLAVAGALHSDPRTSDVPIVFITDHADAQFTQECKAVGGECYFAQPYDMDLLVRLLNGIFEADAIAAVEVISQAKRGHPVRP